MVKRNGQNDNAVSARQTTVQSLKTNLHAVTWLIRILYNFSINILKSRNPETRPVRRD